MVVCWFFSKLTFSKNSFRNTTRASNGLDPDQDCRSWSGAKLFTKVISIRKKLSLAWEELTSSPVLSVSNWQLPFLNQLYGEKNFCCQIINPTLPTALRGPAQLICWRFKVIQCDDAKYTKLTYNMMLNDLQNFPAKSSWAKSVKSLLDNLGFGHVWIEQGVGNINMFLRIFKERLTDNFVQGWDDEVHNSSRANIYKLISNFSFKDCLDFVTVRKLR